MRPTGTSRLARAVVAVLCAIAPAGQAIAATPPVPMVSGPVAGPGLYPTRAQYETRVNQRLDQLTREGWFLPEYADLVRGELKTTRRP